MNEKMYAVGNEELKDQPFLKEGDLAPCNGCGGTHFVEHGTVNGEKSTMLGFVTCVPTGKTFLVAIEGKQIPVAGKR